MNNMFLRPWFVVLRREPHFSWDRKPFVRHLASGPMLGDSKYNYVGWAEVYEREDAARDHYDFHTKNNIEGDLALVFVRAMTKGRAIEAVVKRRGEFIARTVFDQAVGASNSAARSTP
jgi:hypothetical protein